MSCFRRTCSHQRQNHEPTSYVLAWEYFCGKFTVGGEIINSTNFMPTWIIFWSRFRGARQILDLRTPRIIVTALPKWQCIACNWWMGISGHCCKGKISSTSLYVEKNQWLLLLVASHATNIHGKHLELVALSVNCNSGTAKVLASGVLQYQNLFLISLCNQLLLAADFLRAEFTSPN